ARQEPRGLGCLTGEVRASPCAEVERFTRAARLLRKAGHDTLDFLPVPSIRRVLETNAILLPKHVARRLVGGGLSLAGFFGPRGARVRGDVAAPCIRGRETKSKSVQGQCPVEERGLVSRLQLQRAIGCDQREGDGSGVVGDAAGLQSCRGQV